MTRATGFAWVSGNKTQSYTLHVTRVASTRAFRALDGTPFDNFRAAQHIANAIRAFVKVQS